MTMIVMIDDDDDDCDDKVLCPRNVDDPGQRREAAIAPTLAHIIIVIREKYIEIVFHKYLKGALRNTILFSAIAPTLAHIIIVIIENCINVYKELWEILFEYS